MCANTAPSFDLSTCKTADERKHTESKSHSSASVVLLVTGCISRDALPHLFFFLSSTVGVSARGMKEMCFNAVVEGGNKKNFFESLCFEFTHLHEVVQPFVGDHRERAVPAVAILFLCAVLSLETGC